MDQLRKLFEQTVQEKRSDKPTTTDTLPPILTVKQVADIMGWHPNTVYLRCTSGELPSFKSGNSRRIRREAFLEWMQRLESGDAS